jgi:hypothetical protein
LGETFGRQSCLARAPKATRISLGFVNSSVTNVSHDSAIVNYAIIDFHHLLSSVYSLLTRAALPAAYGLNDREGTQQQRNDVLRP